MKWLYQLEVLLTVSSDLLGLTITNPDSETQSLATLPIETPVTAVYADTDYVILGNSISISDCFIISFVLIIIYSYSFFALIQGIRMGS